jgi:hypothetical protein
MSGRRRCAKRRRDAATHRVGMPGAWQVSPAVAGVGIRRAWQGSRYAADRQRLPAIGAAA